MDIDKLPLPPGYASLKPLERDAAAGKGRVRNAQAFASGLNSVYLTAMEFFQAARHYPVVFARDAQSGRFLPVAITGLADGENLFVEHGGWLPNRYVPAWVRRWPFFSVAVRDESNEERSLVCVDASGLTEDTDAPYFTTDGTPTEHWESMQKLIRDFEGARQQTEKFCRDIQDLDLLEAFEAHAVARDGGDRRLGGMFRVSEEKLNALPEKTVKRLMKQGRLSRIYAHLISLENFQTLLDMSVARKQEKGGA